MPMPSPFDEALSGAVSMLRELPRDRQAAPHAASALHTLRVAHPGIDVELVVDQPPGSPRVDYDLVLGHPEGGTVGLCWRADDGVPWAVEYASHWAASFVVSVNKEHVPVQTALMFFRLAGRRVPDLMEELVDQTLVT